ncbi:MAG: MFS transporter [bacterium]|nr:MFS transporter [bacterium]
MPQRTLATYWSLQFATGALMFFHTSYVLFLMSQGLDLFQVNLVNTAFMVTVLVMEIPTGLFADAFGRKKSIVFSLAVSGCAFIVYSQGQSFLHFALAEVLAGIGMALSSGATDAWVFDALKTKQFRGRTDTIFSRGAFAKSLGIILGGLVGSYLSKLDLSLPFLLSGLSFLVLAAISSRLIVETPDGNKKPMAFRQLVRRHALDGVKQELRKPKVAALIFLGMSFSFATMAPNMFWQPYFTQAGLNPEDLGWLFGGMFIITMLGNISVEWFGRNNRAALVSSYALIGCSLLAFWWLPQFLIPAIAFYYLHEFGRGLFRPVSLSMLNLYSASEHRATLLSFDSAAGGLGAVAGLIVSGWLAKNHGIELSWGASGFTMIILLGVGTLLWRRRKTV